MAGALTAGTLGVALLLAGNGFASPSLLIPGLGLLALALVSVVWVTLATTSLRLERSQGPARIVEDEPYPLRIAARGGVLPPPGGELTDSLLAEPLAVGPRWRGLHTAAVAVRGRGLRRLGPARLAVRDPLGLCARELCSADAGELLVLPRIEPVRASQSAGGARARSISGIEDGPATSGLDPRAIELEVDGLRPYRQGSPASRIHWPAVARSGELIERRLVAGADSAPLVVLDASHPAGEEELDRAVRAAASLAHHLASAGGCAVMLPGDRRPTDLEPDRRSWPALHARLALVQPGPAPLPARASRVGTVFWVTASAAPRLPPALSRTGGRRYIVAPAELIPGSADFTVAGCAGVPVGGSGRASRRPPRRPARRRSAA